MQQSHMYSFRYLCSHPGFIVCIPSRGQIGIVFRADSERHLKLLVPIFRLARQHFLVPQECILLQVPLIGAFCFWLIPILDSFQLTEAGRAFRAPYPPQTDSSHAILAYTVVYFLACAVTALFVYYSVASSYSFLAYVGTCNPCTFSIGTQEASKASLEVYKALPRTAHKDAHSPRRYKQGLVSSLFWPHVLFLALIATVSNFPVCSGRLTEPQLGSALATQAASLSLRKKTNTRIMFILKLMSEALPSWECLLVQLPQGGLRIHIEITRIKNALT
jgi:hypothetical protein